MGIPLSSTFLSAPFPTVALPETRLANRCFRPGDDVCYKTARNMGFHDDDSHDDLHLCVRYTMSANSP